MIYDLFPLLSRVKFARVVRSAYMCIYLKAFRIFSIILSQRTSGLSKKKKKNFLDLTRLEIIALFALMQFIRGVPGLSVARENRIHNIPTRSRPKGAGREGKRSMDRRVNDQLSLLVTYAC